MAIRDEGDRKGLHPTSTPLPPLMVRAGVVGSMGGDLYGRPGPLRTYPFLVPYRFATSASAGEAVSWPGDARACCSSSTERKASTTRGSNC